MPYRSSLYDVCGAGHSECGSPTQHFTMIFHSFVFMQVFNEINARKLNNEWNVFGGLQYHAMFIYIFFGTLATQFLLVELPGVNTTFGCEHLEAWQHIFCFLMGVLALPWQACVVHFFPCEWIPLGAWAGAIDDAALDQLTKHEEEAESKKSISAARKACQQQVKHVSSFSSSMSAASSAASKACQQLVQQLVKHVSSLSSQ
eukprot:03092_5